MGSESFPSETDLRHKCHRPRSASIPFPSVGTSVPEHAPIGSRERMEAPFNHCCSIGNDPVTRSHLARGTSACWGLSRANERRPRKRHQRAWQKYTHTHSPTQAGRQRCWSRPLSCRRVCEWLPGFRLVACFSVAPWILYFLESLARRRPKGEK